jgi:hypothetical protein
MGLARRGRMVGKKEHISPLIVKTLAVMFIQLIYAEASAEVATLSCSGTLRVIRAGVSTPEEQWTFAPIVDTDRKTVTVDDWPSVPFLGDTSTNTIAFMPSKPSDYGVSTGTLNRITGETSILIIKTGCKYSTAHASAHDNCSELFAPATCYCFRGRVEGLKNRIFF